MVIFVSVLVGLFLILADLIVNIFRKDKKIWVLYTLYGFEFLILVAVCSIDFSKDLWEAVGIVLIMFVLYKILATRSRFFRK